MIEGIFFDRDGTLGNLTDIRYPQTLVPFEGIRETFAALHAMGIKVFIATNQSSIARGTGAGYDFEAEFASYGADDWFLCPHDSGDGCDCRKPLSGLLRRAAEKYGLNLKNCVMVGDRWSDMKCGADAGARCIFFRNPASPLPSDDGERMDYIRQADAEVSALGEIPAIIRAWEAR